MKSLIFNVKLDEGAIMPTKAHDADAGFDLYSRQYFCIYPHTCRCFDTGVHIEIPNGYVGFLKSKSGLNVNKDIVGEGVIDSGYTGSIIVKLYNHGDSGLDYMGGESLDEILWMMLVELFGNYGTTVRTGWIDDVDGAIEWLKKLRAFCQAEVLEDKNG